MKKIKSFLMLLLALVMVFAFAACSNKGGGGGNGDGGSGGGGGDGGTTTSPTPPTPFTVSLGADEYTVTELDSLTITYTTSETPDQVGFAVADTTKASVTNAGVLTGISAGQTTVTLSVIYDGERYTDTATVKVTAKNWSNTVASYAVEEIDEATVTLGATSVQNGNTLNISVEVTDDEYRFDGVTLIDYARNGLETTEAKIAFDEFTYDQGVYTYALTTDARSENVKVKANVKSLISTMEVNDIRSLKSVYLNDYKADAEAGAFKFDYSNDAMYDGDGNAVLTEQEFANASDFGWEYAIVVSDSEGNLNRFAIRTYRASVGADSWKYQVFYWNANKDGQNGRSAIVEATLLDTLNADYMKEFVQGTLYFAYEIGVDGEIKLYLGRDDNGNLIRFASDKTLYFGNGATAIDCFVVEVNVRCMASAVFNTTSADMTNGIVKQSNNGAVSAQSLISSKVAVELTDNTNGATISGIENEEELTIAESKTFTVTVTDVALIPTVKFNGKRVPYTAKNGNTYSFTITGALKNELVIGVRDGSITYTVKANEFNGTLNKQDGVYVEGEEVVLTFTLPASKNFGGVKVDGVTYTLADNAEKFVVDGLNYTFTIVNERMSSDSIEMEILATDINPTISGTITEKGTNASLYTKSDDLVSEKEVFKFRVGYNGKHPKDTTDTTDTLEYRINIVAGNCTSAYVKFWHNTSGGSFFQCFPSNAYNYTMTSIFDAQVLPKLQAGDLEVILVREGTTLTVMLNTGEVEYQVGTYTDASVGEITSIKMAVGDYALFEEAENTAFTVNGTLYRNAGAIESYYDSYNIVKTVDSVMTVTGLPETAKYGDTVTLTITSSNEAYAPVVTYNGEAVAYKGKSGTTYTYEAITLGLYATFEVGKRDTTVSFTLTDNNLDGTVTASAVEDAPVTVTLEPNANYDFSGIVIDGTTVAKSEFTESEGVYSYTFTNEGMSASAIEIEVNEVALTQSVASTAFAKAPSGKASNDVWTSEYSSAYTAGYITLDYGNDNLYNLEGEADLTQPEYVKQGSYDFGYEYSVLLTDGTTISRYGIRVFGGSNMNNGATNNWNYSLYYWDKDSNGYTNGATAGQNGYRVTVASGNFNTLNPDYMREFSLGKLHFAFELDNEGRLRLFLGSDDNGQLIEIGADKVMSLGNTGSAVACFVSAVQVRSIATHANYSTNTVTGGTVKYSATAITAQSLIPTVTTVNLIDASESVATITGIANGEELTIGESKSFTLTISDNTLLPVVTVNGVIVDGELSLGAYTYTFTAKAFNDIKVATKDKTAIFTVKANEFNGTLNKQDGVYVEGEEVVLTFTIPASKYFGGVKVDGATYTLADNAETFVVDGLNYTFTIANEQMSSDSIEMEILATDINRVINTTNDTSKTNVTMYQKDDTLASSKEVLKVNLGYNGIYPVETVDETTDIVEIRIDFTAGTYGSYIKFWFPANGTIYIQGFKSNALNVIVTEKATQIKQLLLDGKLTVYLVREGTTLTAMVNYSDETFAQNSVTDATIGEISKLTNRMRYQLNDDNTQPGVVLEDTTYTVVGTLYRNAGAIESYYDSYNIVKTVDSVMTVTGLPETAKYGDTVTLTITSSNEAYAPVVTYNGEAVAYKGKSGTTYTYEAITLGLYATFEVGKRDTTVSFTLTDNNLDGTVTASAVEDAPVTVTLEPNANYDFSGIVIDGTTVAKSEFTESEGVYSYTFTNEGMSASAIEIEILEIDINPTISGTITEKGTNASLYTKSDDLVSEKEVFKFRVGYNGKHPKDTTDTTDTLEYRINIVAGNCTSAYVKFWHNTSGGSFFQCFPSNAYNSTMTSFFDAQVLPKLQAGTLEVILVREGNTLTVTLNAGTLATQVGTYTDASVGEITSISMAVSASAVFEAAENTAFTVNGTLYRNVAVNSEYNAIALQKSAVSEISDKKAVHTNTYVAAAEAGAFKFDYSNDAMYDAEGNAVLTEQEFANSNDFGWEYAIVVSDSEGNLNRFAIRTYRASVGADSWKYNLFYWNANATSTTGRTTIASGVVGDLNSDYMKEFAQGTLYFAYEVADNGEIKLYLGRDDNGNLIRFAADKTLYFGNGTEAVDCYVTEVNVRCMGASAFTTTSATMTSGAIKYSSAAVTAQSLITA